MAHRIKTAEALLKAVPLSYFYANWKESGSNKMYSQ